MRPDGLAARLRARAEAQPDRRACLFLGEAGEELAEVSYRELDAAANRIAAKLASTVPPGSRIVLLYPSGPEFVAAFYGCLYAGMIAVPAPLPGPPLKRTLPRLMALIADARPALALTNEATRPAVEAQLSSITVVATTNLPAAPPVPEPVETPSDTAFLQYTSGSTATPKGVMVSHGNLVYNFGYFHSNWHHDDSSVGISWLPLFHDLGLIYGLLQPIYDGFPCVLIPPTAFLKRPLVWLQAITRYRGTHSTAPNFAYDLCVRKVSTTDRDQLDLSSWVVALNAAEPVRRATIDRFTAYFAPAGFRAQTMSPGYGLAEATLKVSTHPMADPPVYVTVKTSALEQHRVVPAGDGDQDVRTLVGCGTLDHGTRALIVDPDRRVAAAADEIGEIWLSGPGIAQGYWQRPQETEETFGARTADGEGPFLRTGDLGFLRDGQLYVTGRLKDLVIIRGVNHYPHDIELTVEKVHPGLRPGGGAAFSIEVEDAEELAIVHELDAPSDLEVCELMDAIRLAVTEAHQVRVAAITLIEPRTLPKTSSGKVQRRLTRELWRTGALQTIAQWRLPVGED